MTAMYGLFDKPDAAQRAYTSLKRAGVPSGDITVVSGEPFEAFEFSHRDHSMILFRLALVGGSLAERLGPTGLDHLAAAPQRQGIGRHVGGYHRA